MACRHTGMSNWNSLTSSLHASSSSFDSGFSLSGCLQQNPQNMQRKVTATQMKMMREYKESEEEEMPKRKSMKMADLISGDEGPLCIPPAQEVCLSFLPVTDCIRFLLLEILKIIYFSLFVFTFSSATRPPWLKGSAWFKFSLSGSGQIGDPFKVKINV